MGASSNEPGIGGSPEQRWSVIPLVGLAGTTRPLRVGIGEIVRIPEEHRAELLFSASPELYALHNVSPNLGTHAYVAQWRDGDEAHWVVEESLSAALALGFETKVWTLIPIHTEEDNLFVTAGKSSSLDAYQPLTVSDLTDNVFSRPISLDQSGADRLAQVHAAIRALWSVASPVRTAIEQLMVGDAARRGSRRLFEYVAGLEALLLPGGNELRFRFRALIAELAPVAAVAPTRTDWFSRARVLYDRRSDYAHGNATSVTPQDLRDARNLLRLLTVAAALLGDSPPWKTRRDHLYETLLGEAREIRHALAEAADLIELTWEPLIGIPTDRLYRA